MNGLSRRRFASRLAASTAFLPMASCTNGLGAPDQDWDAALGSIIDVHCHVFNITDLPAAGFVRATLLHDHDANGLVARFLEELEALLGAGVPTAAEEVAEFASLRRAAERELRRLDARAAQTHGERAVRRVLERLREQQKSLRDPSDSRGDRLRDALERHLGRRQAAQPDAPVDAAPGVRAIFDKDLGNFLELVCNSRRENIEEYLRLYGGKGRVALFTPALVDFGLWVGDQPKSPFRDQIEVMDRLQRAVARDGRAHMHGFMAFDPWAAIRDPGILPLVKHAILERGFVGVKLYPPMGFLPGGNERSGLSYPQELVGSSPDSLRRIDRVLDDLYAWCQQDEVPIMAHATASWGSHSGYEKRANPKRWLPVLAKFPGLRINLGHFGDFEELAGSDPAWEDEIGRLLLGPGAGRVFADFSYFGEALPWHGNAGSLEQLAGHWRRYLRSYDASAESLMFGTDWLMLGIELGNQTYVGAVGRFLSALGATEPQRVNLRRRNAVRFLGLAPGNGTRRRLDAYYKKHALDARWLDEISSL